MRGECRRASPFLAFCGGLAFGFAEYDWSDGGFAVNFSTSRQEPTRSQAGHSTLHD